MDASEVLIQVDFSENDTCADIFQKTSADIEERNGNLGLIQIFSQAPPVQAISRIHNVKVINETPKTFLLTRESNDDANARSADNDVNDDKVGNDDSEVNANDAMDRDGCVNVEVKDWVMVEYNQVAYPGEVVVKEGNHWKWPNPRDTIFYKSSQIYSETPRACPNEQL